LRPGFAGLGFQTFPGIAEDEIDAASFTAHTSPHGKEIGSETNREDARCQPQANVK